MKTKQDAINLGIRAVKKLSYTGLHWTYRVEKSRHSDKWLIFVTTN